MSFFIKKCSSKGIWRTSLTFKTQANGTTCRKESVTNGREFMPTEEKTPSSWIIDMGQHGLIPTFANLYCMQNTIWPEHEPAQSDLMKVKTDSLYRGTVAIRFRWRSTRCIISVSRDINITLCVIQISSSYVAFCSPDNRLLNLSDSEFNCFIGLSVSSLKCWSGVVSHADAGSILPHSLRHVTYSRRIAA